MNIMGSSSRTEISMMTYNVYMNGHLNETKAAKTIQAISELGTGVVFLQESNEGWQHLLESQLSSLYPHSYFHNDKYIWGGRGVLSKYPITSTYWLERVFPFWYGALLTKLDVNGVEVAVLNIHLKAPFPSNPFTVQSERRHEIETHMKQLDSTKNLVVLGDFNTSRGPCHEYLITLGFQNALSVGGKIRKSAKTYSLTSRIGFLFDHIYFKPSDFHLLDEDINKVGGSDHWPLYAKFQIQDD